MLKVNKYSKSTAHMRSNGRHFLTARLFMFWIYKFKKKINGEQGNSSFIGNYVLQGNCTYWVKKKPLFDSWILNVLDIKGKKKHFSMER